MEYRVIYDVRADGWPWVSTAWPLVVAVLAVQYYRPAGRVPGEPAAGRRAPRWPGLLILLALVFFAGRAADAFRGQWRCRAWAEAGEYQVAEGRVAGYRSDGRRSGESFRVGGLVYHGSAGRAGYRGRFTAPGAGTGALRDGVGARVAHRDGCILRIEVTP